ncbi:lipopolysaccharide biosynthesis protein [Antarctobacter sp.]|uniref:lipopolysaccharide biosynthesis protein n=1 Tax=Antarctobacter sp. TaxID=1872577 RepID=UPI003A9160F4
MTGATVGGSRGPLSLKRNIGFAMIGRGWYAATQFLIIALTARLGTPADVGAFTLASSIVTPLFFLATMGTRDVLTVDDLDRFNRADYLGLRITGSVAAVAVSMAVAFSAYGGRGWLVLGAVAGMAMVRFFGAQASLNHAMFQRAERLDYVAGSILLRSSAGLAGFAVVFWYTRDLPLALLAEAALWGLSYWGVDSRLLRRLGLATPVAALKGTNLRRIGTLALWVLPVGLALWLMRAAHSIPPLVLERHAGLAAVGLFGALAYVHTVLSMLANAMSSAAAARLRRYARSGRIGDFRRLTRRMVIASLGLGALAVALAWLFGNPFVRFVFGADYVDRRLLTLIVLASALYLVAGPLVTGVTALQAFRWRVAISGSCFLAGSIAALTLVPQHGALGAGGGFLASGAAYLTISALAHAWLTRRRQTDRAVG